MLTYVYGSAKNETASDDIDHENTKEKEKEKKNQWYRSWENVAWYSGPVGFLSFTKTAEMLGDNTISQL